MARLERPPTPQSRDAGAFIARGVFTELRVDRVDFGRYCRLEGDEVRVGVSPASLDYLKRLAPAEQDRQVIRALPYAKVNSRPRIWSTDFALQSGCRTEAEVREWHVTRGVVIRSRSYGSLLVPPEGDASQGSLEEAETGVTLSGAQVTREDVIEAIQRFRADYPDASKYDDWLNKATYRFALIYEGELFPPKYILSLASGIDTTVFSGGVAQTNVILGRLGFEVVDKPMGRS